MTDWLPIETAPRDGTEVLIFVPGLRCWQRCLTGPITVGAWQPGSWGNGGWYTDSSSDMEGYESTGDYVVHEPVHPTHWMALPDHPTIKEDGK